jgi:hypothetical protein
MLASLPQELRAHIWSFRAEAFAKATVCRRCCGIFWDCRGNVWVRAGSCPKCTLRTRVLELGTGCCTLMALSYFFLSRPCAALRILLAVYLLAFTVTTLIVATLVLATQLS